MLQGAATMKLKYTTALALSLLFPLAAQAVPMLQLDIEGGTYLDGTEETTVTTDSVFNLWALGETSRVTLGKTYYLSVALLPASENLGDPANFGSVTVDGIALGNTIGQAEFGTPPIEDIDNDLPSHGIFDTYYYEIAFLFDGSPTIDSYDAQDGNSANGSLYQRTFAIDASSLAFGYGLHFDLYTYDSEARRTRVTDFAPFSHDAAYCVELNCNPVEVTEPGTLGLMGLGLLGLLTLRRKIAPGR
jgi:hypothetical protein